VERFAAAVREHRGIENGLYWALDVGFREEVSRVRKESAPENLAVIRHTAANLLSQNKSAKRDVCAKRLKAGGDNQYLLRVLSRRVCVYPDPDCEERCHIWKASFALLNTDGIT